MARPLAVCGLGMVSCLAWGAKINAAAMRCGYSNFLPTEFYIERTREQQLGAVAFDCERVGTDRLVEMAGPAIEEALQGGQSPITKIPIIVNFPTAMETPGTWPDGLHNVFFHELQSRFTNLTFTLDSLYHRAGKFGIVKGLSQAQTLLYDTQHEYVLLLGVDSLLNNHRIKLYENYNDMQRLLGEENPDGFIPGEAAVAVLLAKPNGTEQTCITGIGYGMEQAVVDSEAVLKAEGLTAAIQNAVKDAGCRVCDTQFIIAGVNGESYYFKEVSLARTKALEQKVISHPLWHPVDSIGETGAAVGGAIIVMGHFAFEKRYAPGARALCVVSNDDEARGAFILERIGG